MNLLETRDIAFSHGERTIIQGVSVRFEAGYFYGIIGPNGCGKTTLIDLLIGIKKPGAGKIIFKGKNIENYKRKHIAREIALLPQELHINFPFTVYDVVMMGRTPFFSRFSAPGKKDREIVSRVMEETGVTSFADRFITELSGGERQRVIFARALAQQTSVLCLDEPTSNMDIDHTLYCMESAQKRVAENRATVIAVFQDMNLATRYCDRLILMKNGAVSACGDIHDVLTVENIKAVFHVEPKIYVEPYTGSKKIAFLRPDHLDSDSGIPLQRLGKNHKRSIG